MCQPASFVLTRERVFFSKSSNSHNTIIEEHALHEYGVAGANILRVELVPPAGDYDLDPATWLWKVDQDVLPSWIRGDEESRTRKSLLEWRQYHCCTQEDVTETMIGGFRVKQIAASNVRQKADDYAVQTAKAYAVQTAKDNAEQIATLRAYQFARDNARQEAGSSAFQIAMDKATQIAGAFSNQKAGLYSYQLAGERSIQTAGPTSTQIAGDYSIQRAGCGSMQQAGILSTQIGELHKQVFSRVVTPEMANKPYLFKKGVWYELWHELDPATKLHFGLTSE